MKSQRPIRYDPRPKPFLARPTAKNARHPVQLRPSFVRLLRPAPPPQKSIA